MKRILFIAYFFSIWFYSFSQSIQKTIQDSFFGCTLGKTTRSECIEILSSKGLTLDYDGSKILIINPRFASEKWDLGCLDFYDGILFYFSVNNFVNGPLGYTENTVKQQYEGLVNILSNKYPNLPLLSANENNWTVADNTSYCCVIIEEAYTKMLKLEYYNIKLLNEWQSDAIEDL